MIPEKKSGAGSDQERDAANDAENIAFNEFAAVNGSAATHFENGRPVPIVDGIKATEFDEPDVVESFMTPRDRISWEVRRAALRIYLGFDGRKMRDVGRELGVGKAAISRVYQDLVKRLGGGLVFKRAETRARLSQATTRCWQDPEKRAQMLGGKAA